jgi:hypothetical protein
MLKSTHPERPLIDLLRRSPVSGEWPSEDGVEYSANSADRSRQFCEPSGFDLSDGYCGFCLATSESLPSQFYLVFFGGALIEMFPNLARL